VKVPGVPIGEAEVFFWRLKVCKGREAMVGQGCKRKNIFLAILLVTFLGWLSDPNSKVK